MIKNTTNLSNLSSVITIQFLVLVRALTVVGLFSVFCLVLLSKEGQINNISVYYIFSLIIICSSIYYQQHLLHGKGVSNAAVIFPDTITSKEERFYGYVFFNIVSLGYGEINQWAAHQDTVFPILAMSWERNIPFIPIFAIPYVSFFLLCIIAFSCSHTKKKLSIHLARLIIASLVSFAIFIVFPTEMGLPRHHDVESDPLLGSIFIFINNDHPYNLMPSLHITNTILYWLMIKDFIENVWLKIIAGLWFLAVLISVLFVEQHHFIDVVTAMLLVFIVVKISRIKIIQNTAISLYMSLNTIVRKAHTALYFGSTRSA